MKRRRCLLSVGFAAALCAPLALAYGPQDKAPAKTEAPADAKARVVELLKQLGSDKAAERDAASAELVKLGAATIKNLPPLDDKTLGEERRKRIVELLPKIWQAKVGKDLEASKVKLPKGQMALADVLKELEKQTGNAVKDMREEFNEEPTNPQVELDGKDRTFWEALDDVCKKASVAPYHFAGDRTLAIRAVGASPDTGVGPTRTFGAFRFSAQSLGIERNFATSAHDCNIRLLAVFEPRIRPIGVTVDTNEIKVVDDKGRALDLREKREFNFGVEGGAHHFELGFKTAAPARDAAKIKKLSGTATIAVAANVDKFELENWFFEKGEE
ncbi:MAG TPA: hypothetical protein VNC50_13025, partial [Planctomycetia bacterium]|nr:hypothetical protein [Planctomycetia bacterium]